MDHERWVEVLEAEQRWPRARCDKLEQCTAVARVELLKDLSAKLLGTTQHDLRDQRIRSALIGATVGSAVQCSAVRW